MFQPAIPFDGLVGWRFLQRTLDTQLESFAASPPIQRDAEYFRENIGKVQTAEELVADRRLLTVALGAYGLQDDINNKFFIQKMLEEGTTNEDSFANRFADTRYRDFSEAFGLGPGELRQNLLPGFADRIISRFERQSFEVAVGEQSDTLRVALSAERAFADLATSTSSVEGKWFDVLGQPPLRSLFETAFGLPQSFGQIDIDQQREVFEEKSLKAFGASDPADFADPELQEALLTRYTALAQVRDFQVTTSGASVALALLQQA